MKKRKKVIIALSGGVDSSVAAGILKNKGYEVIGLFLNMHDNCDSKEAKQAAQELDIPLKILNVKKEFKQKIIDYFVQEYKNGRTPNPCVECNQWIKFKFLFEQLRKLKADYVATGHYAKIFQDSKKNYKLLKAKDEKKDQSYFLWTLKQKQLSRIIFPLGSYTKAEVKNMAKKRNLSSHDRKESQEVCFIKNIDLSGFLKKKIKTKKGPIITTNERVIGKHDGLYLYTIGQRKRIGVGGIQSSPTGPFYVVEKNNKKNALIVAQGDFHKDLFKKQMTLENINWISKTHRFPLKCSMKIRYLHKSVPATINKNKVIFNKPQRAITPGQSAVFYKSNQVLGGGVIKKAG